VVEIGSVSVVMDCTDPRTLMAWWHRLTGWEIRNQEDDWCSLTRPDGTSLGFQKVPEPKTVKNRVHLDLWVEDEEEAAKWAVEELGARRLWRSENPDDPFVVLADPEGDEFCFCAAPQG